jgi:hypothetical protein
MPAFIKTDTDEKHWSRAKAYAKKSYPELSEDDDQFWAITTSIYKKLRGRNMKKSASSRVFNVLQKLAYVPLTPAAEEAVAGGMPPQGGMPPMDPAMGQGGGMPPMPPMDPNMGGQPPMPPQGGGVQAVPGPNGEPIDPETGFIVIDPAAGIEQDPLTGILFNKSNGEFATPDGQLIPPDQAQAMIEEAMAMAQGGAMPPQGGMPPMPPMDPAAGAMPPMSDPAMTQQPGQPQLDPMSEAMAGGQPMIDPQSGLPIDPATGMFAQSPQAAAPAGGVGEGRIEELMSGLEGFMDKNDKISDRQDKLNKRMLHDLAGTRTDIQGVRREIQQLNDNQDTLMARLENVLNVLESMMGRPRGSAPLE